MSKILDWMARKGLLGSPVAKPQHMQPYVQPNRKQRRIAQAMRLKALSEPARRKHEKRGHPDRRSKGRVPFRPA